MKYVYNNKVYQVEVYPKPKSFFQVEKGMASPLSTLIPSSHIEHMEEKKQEIEKVSKLLDDDLGSLEFTPSFM